MSNLLLNKLSELHQQGLKQFIYVSDKDKFGDIERWESEEVKFLNGETFRGDCDTYALTMIRSALIKGLILKENALLFACKVGKIGHLISGILVDDTTYIFDNRMPNIVTLKDLSEGITYIPKYYDTTITEKYEFESFAIMTNFTVFYKRKDGYPYDFTKHGKTASSINWDNYPNFSEVEFKCNCGCGKVAMKVELINKLQEIRILMNEPIRVISGFRCKKHNKKVGGKKRSAHLTGEAVDIAIPNSRYRFKLKKAIYNNGFKRLGDYRKQGFIHIDISKTLPQNVEW